MEGAQGISSFHPQAQKCCKVTYWNLFKIFFILLSVCVLELDVFEFWIQITVVKFSVVKHKL